MNSSINTFLFTSLISLGVVSTVLPSLSLAADCIVEKDFLNSVTVYSVVQGQKEKLETIFPARHYREGPCIFVTKLDQLEQNGACKVDWNMLKMRLDRVDMLPDEQKTTCLAEAEEKIRTRQAIKDVQRGISEVKAISDPALSGGANRVISRQAIANQRAKLVKMLGPEAVSMMSDEIVAATLRSRASKAR